MDSGSHTSEALLSESFSLFSTAHDEFVQDLNAPQGLVARRPTSRLHHELSSRNGGKASAPFAAPSRTNCSDSGCALPSAYGTASRWFTPSLHPSASADLKSTPTQSNPVDAAGFASQSSAHGQVQGTTNTVLLVDSCTGAILGTADPKLVMQLQRNAVDDGAQAAAAQHAVPPLQQPAFSEFDDETLLTVATATGLDATDASGSAILASSSSNSQALQQPFQPSGIASTNKVDARCLGPAQQQMGIIATLATLLQSATSGVFKKASTGLAEQHTKYKTELCRGWLELGTCRYGPKCQFAHGPKELRSMPTHPEVCRSYLATGKCKYGPSCRFIHNTPPCLVAGANAFGNLATGSLLASMGAGGSTKQQTHAPVQRSLPNALGALGTAAGSGSAVHMGLEGVSGWDDQPVMPRSNAVPAPSLLRNTGCTSPGAAPAPKQPNLFALRVNGAAIRQTAAPARLSTDNLVAAGANLAWEAGNCVASQNSSSSRVRSLDGSSSAYSHVLCSRISYDKLPSSNSGSSIALSSIVVGGRTSLESTASPGACSTSREVSEADYAMGTHSPSKVLSSTPCGNQADQRADSLSRIMVMMSAGQCNAPATTMAPILEGVALPPMVKQ